MSLSSPVRVMLIDDHDIVREGLAEVLRSAGGYEIVGQAGDGVEGVEMAAEVKPDIVIMDIIMPRMDGIAACRDIVAKLPNTKVMVLTASSEEDAVIEAMAAGATGYLQKLAGKEKFISTINDVLDGEFRIPAEVMKRVITGLRSGASSPGAPDADPLTGREREILSLFARGQSYADIAEARGNKPLTIRNAIYSIQSKLGTRTKQELVVWAVRNGLVDD